MGDVRITLGVAACLTILVGCAAQSVGQVQELGPGTYSIGVGRSRTLASGAEDMKEAVNKAGEYCLLKGRKLLIVPNPGNDVTFRCVSDEVAPANSVSEQRAPDPR